MKRILVIGGHSASSDDVAELTRFCEGVRQTYDGAEVGMLHVDQLQFVIEPEAMRVLDSKNGQQIAGADLVILRNKMRTYSTIAYCLSRYCITEKVNFFNDYSAYFPGTKIAQAVIFYEQRVPFLKTVYAMDHAALTAIIKKELSLPFVLKDAFGAQGTANYLIRSFEDLEKCLAGEPDTAFIAQEFCPNDRDYRVLVMSDDHLVFKRQGVAGTHLNNTSQGAEATLAMDDVPAPIIEQSHQLARHMGLRIAGVDVVPRLNSHEFYFIETNSQPQIFTGALHDEKRLHFARLLQNLLG
ncbi:MAG: hypothetical protein AAB834_01115 [Patescibacteria group bacterium]